RLMSNGNRKPEKVFRIGYVTASIFAREITTDDGKRILHSVNVQKRYVEGTETKYTSSFGLAELPQAIRVLQLASEWVEQQEASVELDG
ncbi:MAG TPA: hypothetical protein PK992_20145, partial [Planctomycetaceae bacterium]|nr:hypothetical protein [Planctomycetaceae bacterium]